MECNKDEAVRAKQLAESRMQRGQFVEALKFANKAKKMYADVDNIAQILAICEVHIAAFNKLSSSEMDWYQILQTERLSEEAIIKKQYRKLALLLHPDKNKFAGAEAAFKLIGEANSVLSDQAKRSLHDMKVKKAHARAAVHKTPSQARASVPKSPSHARASVPKTPSHARRAVPKTPSHHSTGNMFAANQVPNATKYKKKSSSDSPSWNPHLNAQAPKTSSHHSYGNMFAASTPEVREILGRIMQQLQSLNKQLEMNSEIIARLKQTANPLEQIAKKRRK